MSGPVMGLLAAHDHAVWEDFGPFSWAVVGLASLISAWVIWKAVRYTLDPGEEEPDHVKRSILHEPDTVEGGLSSRSGRGANPQAPGAGSANGA